MTNDEYQRIASEERRRQEQEAFNRRMREDQERQQRESRARADAQRLAAQSRNLGRMGAFTFGSPVNLNEYRQGLWEHEQQKRAEKERKERAQKDQRPFAVARPATAFPAGPAACGFPVSATARRTYSRKRRFIGAVSRWFVGHAWPFSALFTLGQDLRDASRKGKTIAALLGGATAVILFHNSPSLTVRLGQELNSAIAAYAIVFAAGALVGCLTPAVLGTVLCAAVGLTGIALELGVYAGAVWLVVKTVKAFN